MSISRRTLWKTLGAAVAGCVAIVWPKRSTAAPEDVQRLVADANLDLSDPKWRDCNFPDYIGDTTNMANTKDHVILRNTFEEGSPA